MSTPTAPCLDLRLVPVTPAVAALLHQLQQEVAEAQAVPEPGSIVLSPAGPLSMSSANNDGYHAAYSDDYDSSVYLLRAWTRDGWTGEERRRDADGRCWTRRIVAVVNDFGSLVEVQA